MLFNLMTVGTYFLQLLLSEVANNFEDYDGEDYKIGSLCGSTDEAVPLQIFGVVSIFAGAPLALFYVLLQHFVPDNVTLRERSDFFVRRTLTSIGGVIRANRNGSILFTPGLRCHRLHFRRAVYEDIPYPLAQEPQVVENEKGEQEREVQHGSKK